MSFKVITGILAADVPNLGTFTTAYLTDTNIGTFTGGVAHILQVGQITINSPAGFSLSFGASSITVTNHSGNTLTAGSTFYLQLETLGDDNIGDATGGFNPKRAAIGELAIISLGSPITADADGISASQSVTVATTPLALIDGALALNGAVRLDAPRNVVAAWTNTAIITVTGKDEYDNTVVEKSASGTSLTGKKAFKTITSVSFSADVTGATVGTGDVLGLPVFLGGTAYVLKELQDSVAATAGTLVAGIQTAGGSTATTGDVRGTYDPNAACDGSKSFQLIACLPDPKYAGISQYAG